MFERKIDNYWSFKTANTKEFTHCYHAYPAMMIPQVARTLIEKFAPKGRMELLFDPYMGSGTSLVEALIKGINSVGTDINPLAKLISLAKITHFNTDQIEKRCAEMQLIAFKYNPKNVINTDFSHISNYSYWYSEDVLLKLSFLSQIIEDIEIENQLFFKIALSEVVREVSFTRNGEFKRFRMAEDKIKNFKPDVFRLFEEKIARNLKGLKEYNQVNTQAVAKVFSFNTVEGIPCDVLPKNAVDMIVTSPPYGDSHTTVAYGQFSRWANEWFNLIDGENIDNLLMGGKRQLTANFETESIKDELQQIKEVDNKRYTEVISFLNDYHNSIKNISPIIRQGGRICYVVGNRNVKGVQIPLDYFTAEMFEKYGFKHEITIVREIPNKRMPLKTSPTNKPGLKVSTMSNEYIVIMTKK